MMEVKTVIELFPNRGPGHKLTIENSLDGLTPGTLYITEKGQFFNKTAWMLKPGWRLVGWASPPYPRGENEEAIVFEKVEPDCSNQEPGIYWRHGRVNEKFIVDTQAEQE